MQTSRRRTRQSQQAGADLAHAESVCAAQGSASAASTDATSSTTTTTTPNSSAACTDRALGCGQRPTKPVQGPAGRGARRDDARERPCDRRPERGFRTARHGTIDGEQQPAALGWRFARVRIGNLRFGSFSKRVGYVGAVRQIGTVEPIERIERIGRIGRADCQHGYCAADRRRPGRHRRRAGDPCGGAAVARRGDLDQPHRRHRRLSRYRRRGRGQRRFDLVHHRGHRDVLVRDLRITHEHAGRSDSRRGGGHRDRRRNELCDHRDGRQSRARRHVDFR